MLVSNRNANNQSSQGNFASLRNALFALFCLAEQNNILSSNQSLAKVANQVQNQTTEIFSTFLTTARKIDNLLDRAVDLIYKINLPGVAKGIAKIVNDISDFFFSGPNVNHVNNPTKNQNHHIPKNNYLFKNDAAADQNFLKNYIINKKLDHKIKSINKEYHELYGQHKNNETVERTQNYSGQIAPSKIMRPDITHCKIWVQQSKDTNNQK